MRTRTARINSLRGYCREFGLHIAQGARLGLEQIARAIADPDGSLPQLLRPTMRTLLDEVRLLEVRIAELEKQLSELARLSPACNTLLSIPGVGLLTATAMIASTSGEVAHFKDARHFAAWFGLTPREHSSGQHRTLGKISRRGVERLHGARAAHARRTRRHSRRDDETQGRTLFGSAANLGTRSRSTQQSQQSGLCSRQQNGSHLLRHLA